MVFNSCDWNDPGHNPYVGTIAAAVNRYSDIDPAIRLKLIKRITLKEYDDIAIITKRAVEGYSGFRDMHFGRNDVCSTVNTSKWSSTAKQEGLVYCEANNCLIVPNICGNISRINKVPLKRVTEISIPGFIELPTIEEFKLTLPIILPDNVPTGSDKYRYSSVPAGDEESTLGGDPSVRDNIDSGNISFETSITSQNVDTDPGTNNPSTNNPGTNDPGTNNPGTNDPYKYTVVVEGSIIPVIPVPEPGTYLLMLAGLAVIVGKSWLDRRAK